MWPPTFPASHRWLWHWDTVTHLLCAWNGTNSSVCCLLVVCVCVIRLGFHLSVYRSTLLLRIASMLRAPGCSRYTGDIGVALLPYAWCHFYHNKSVAWVSIGRNVYVKGELGRSVSHLDALWTRQVGLLRFWLVIVQTVKHRTDKWLKVLVHSW